MALLLLGALQTAAVGAAPSTIGADAADEEPCLGRELGVAWPRVAARLREHLAAAAPGAAARARAAVEAELPEGFLADFEEQGPELWAAEFGCSVGWAALALLLCVGPAGCCQPEALMYPARVVLGLHAWNTWRILREGWAVHALLAAVVARTTGLVPAGILEERAQAPRWRRPDAGRASEVAPEALLERLCPYRPPFAGSLCADGAGSGEAAKIEDMDAALATTSAHLAAAVRRTQHNAQLAEAVSAKAEGTGGCQGLEGLCQQAVADEEVRSSLGQAQGIIRWSLRHMDPNETYQLLTNSNWPVLEQLTELFALLQRRPPLGREAPHAAAGAQVTGAWACTMRSWGTTEARSVAASMRLLGRFGAVAKDVQAWPELLLQEAAGADAEAACLALRPRRTLAEALREGAAPQTDLPYYHLSAGARALEDHANPAALEPEDHDANACIPGMMAISLACSVVAISRNDLQGWYPLHDFVVVNGKILGRSGLPPTGYWTTLLPFLHGPHLVQSIWDAALGSSSWWLGSGAAEGPVGNGLTEALPAGPCTGVLDASTSHSCQFQAGITAPDVRAAELATQGLPALRILGVGLMKSGSTAVIQALRAALQRPMGFDCEAPKVAIAALVWRVRRREEALHSLLQACAQEIFAFELAKEPNFSPLAQRLAAAWPSISQHGDTLQLYFVVRNPYGFILSMSNRLGLEVGRGSTEEQRFGLHRLPRSFPRNYQLYLDTPREGLRYSGYLDALAQRWALEVDEYLRCPQRFVLVRFEDFKKDPVQATEQLLLQLGLGQAWDDDAAKRVAESASLRYQGRGQALQPNLTEAFGGPLRQRLWDALGPRASRLGYGALGPEASTVPEDASTTWAAPIDVPPMPQQHCL